MQNKTELRLQSLITPHRAGRVLLILFAFLLPLTKLLNEFGPILQITGALLILLAILDALVYKRTVLSHAHIIAFVLFTWIIVALLWANNIQAGAKVVFRYAEIFGIFWLSYYFLNNSYSLKYVLSSYVMGIILLLIIIFMIQFMIGPDMHPWATYNRRLQLRIINANAVSYILLFATVSVLLILTKTEEKRKKIALLPLLVLFLLGILLTGTRSAIVALTLAIVPASLYVKKNIIYVSIMCAALVIPIAMLISPGALVRIAELFIWLFSDGSSIFMGSSSIETLNYRLAIWRAGASLIKSNPLVGVGIGQFEPLVDPVLPRATAPHNAFVEIFAELGIIGLLLFLFLFRTIFVIIYKNSNGKERPIMVLFIVSTFVMISVTNVLGSTHLWFILGVLLANAKMS